MSPVGSFDGCIPCRSPGSGHKGRAGRGVTGDWAGMPAVLILEHRNIWSLERFWSKYSRNEAILGTEVRGCTFIPSDKEGRGGVSHFLTGGGGGEAIAKL